MAGAQAEIQKKQGEAVNEQATAEHKIAMANQLRVQTAHEALKAAHAHSDHLTKAARGGIDPHHFIPSAEHTTPSAEHLMPSAEHLIPPAENPGQPGLE
jgi:hypothetical protein